MKQTNQSELQVGELYCDQPRLHSINAVVMLYLGKVKGHHEFKYVSGISEYIDEGDGIIRLAHYTKEPNWVPTEKANVINEATK